MSGVPPLTTIKMKTKLLTALCVTALTLGSATSGLADDGATMIADTVVVRPACLVATVVGSAFFVLALPFAALSKSVHPTAHALVVVPARATFSRQVGDMDMLRTD